MNSISRNYGNNKNDEYDELLQSIQLAYFTFPSDRYSGADRCFTY